LIFMLVLSFFCLVGTVVMMGVDSKSVYNSSQWCKDGLSGVEWSPSDPSIHCNYTPFIIVCVLDAAVFLAWAMNFGFMIRYLRKWKPSEEDYTSLDEVKHLQSDDPTTPIQRKNSKHSKHADSLRFE